MKEHLITHVICCGLIGGCVVDGATVWAQGTRGDYERAADLRKRTQGTVFKQQVAPHWFDQGRKFWYRNDLPGNTHEFILVDAWRASRRAAFDHQKLSQALSLKTSTKVDARNLPFQEIRFDSDGHVRFR
ncbi:MAG: S9 family peptidase, partial [Planctomycetaceae bacterium]